MNNIDFFKGNASSLYSKRVPCPKCGSMDTESSVLAKTFAICGIFFIMLGMGAIGSFFFMKQGLVIFGIGVIFSICAIIDGIFFKTVQMKCKECGNVVQYKGNVYNELAKKTVNPVDLQINKKEK